jgi:hypothetical protein
MNRVLECTEADTIHPRRTTLHALLATHFDHDGAMGTMINASSWVKRSTGIRAGPGGSSERSRRFHRDVKGNSC